MQSGTTVIIMISIIQTVSVYKGSRDNTLMIRLGFIKLKLFERILMNRGFVKLEGTQ